MRTILNDYALFQEYLTRARHEGAGEYRLPDMRLDVSVEEFFLEGMKVFVLNRQEHCRGRMLYFHGGGYVSDPIAVHLRFLNRLSRETGWEIWLPVYPKIPWSHAEDSYRLLLQLYRQFTGEAGGWGRGVATAFVGDSAGGALALGMAQVLAQRGDSVPERLLLLSPWLDATLPHLEPEEGREGGVISPAVLREAGRLWAGTWNLKDHRISPIYGSLDGLGQIFLCSGTRDLLHQDAERLNQMAVAAGTPIKYLRRPGLGHLYTLLTAKGLKMDWMEILTFMK